MAAPSASDPGTELARLRDTPAARALVRAAAPARAWLVGGALRDALLGAEPADLDALVEGDAAATATRAAAALGTRALRLGGDRFAAWRLVVPGGGILDLWQLGHDDLGAELGRRDFTINALALDLATGVLVDPWGGVADLRRGLLRATRPGVFAEDPLRVVRLARFAATLAGFRAEPETAAHARAAAPRLAGLAGERIRQELVRLWPRASYAGAQSALELAGCWPELWRPAPPAAPVDAAAGTAAALLDRIDPRPGPSLDATVRVAAGQALAARAAAGPERAPAVLAALARRAVLAGDELRAATRLLEPLGARPPADERDLAWLLYRAGPAWRAAFGLAAGAAGAEAEAWTAATGRAAALLARRGPELLAPRPLLDGEEIGRLLGVPPGPAVGAAKQRLLEAQVRGTVATAAAARRFLRDAG